MCRGSGANRATQQRAGGARALESWDLLFCSRVRDAKRPTHSALPIPARPPARWCVAFLSPNSSAPGRPPHPVSSHAGATHVKTCAKPPPPRCESPAGSDDANGRCQAPVQRAGRYSGKERSSSSPARLSSHALCRSRLVPHPPSAAYPRVSTRPLLASPDAPLTTLCPPSVALC